MRNVICVFLPEYEEGRHDVLSYVVDPDDKEPEEVLEKIKKLLIGAPLGVLGQALSKM